MGDASGFYEGTPAPAAGKPAWSVFYPAGLTEYYYISCIPKRPFPFGHGMTREVSDRAWPQYCQPHILPYVDALMTVSAQAEAVSLTLSRLIFREPPPLLSRWSGLCLLHCSTHLGCCIPLGDPPTTPGNIRSYPRQSESVCDPVLGGGQGGSSPGGHPRLRRKRGSQRWAEDDQDS